MDLSILPDDIIKYIESFVDKSHPCVKQINNYCLHTQIKYVGRFFWWDGKESDIGHSNAYINNEQFEDFTYDGHETIGCPLYTTSSYYYDYLRKLP